MKLRITSSLLLIVLVITGMLSIPVTAAPPDVPTNPGTTNLISWWALDEQSGARNDSHGTNHLTDNNTVGYTTGIKSNAAQFVSANSEYLSRADNAALSTGDINFEFGAWVYLSTKTATQRFISKWVGSAASLEYLLVYDQPTDRFIFYVYSGSTAGTATASTFGSPSISTWYYISAYHDATNNYVGISVDDGTVNSSSYSLGVQDTGSAFILGALSDGSGGFVNGAIDEVYMYKRVLTADERTWLYNSGAGRAYCEVASNCPVTDTPTSTATNTATNTATDTATSTATNTSVYTSTFTNTPTDTPTPSDTPTATPTGPTPTPGMPTLYWDSQITYGDAGVTITLSLLCLVIVIGLMMYLVLYIMPSRTKRP